MSDTQIKLSPEKCEGKLEQTGKSHAQFAKSAGIDVKTVKKAFSGDSVRKTKADEIAKAFKCELADLLDDEDRDTVADDTITVDLRDTQITEGANVRVSFDTRTHALRDRCEFAVTCDAAELVSNMGKAQILGWDPLYDIKSDSTRPPKPYFHLHSDVVRSTKLIEGLKALNAAIEEQDQLITGARSLSELITTLEAEDTVDSAMQQLAKAGYHILSDVLEICLNDGYSFDSDYPQWATYRVPIFVLARTSVSCARVLYQTVDKANPVYDVYRLERDGSVSFVCDAEDERIPF